MNRDNDEEFWTKWSRGCKSVIEKDDNYFEEECKDEGGALADTVDKFGYLNRDRDAHFEEDLFARSSLDYLTNRLLSTLSSTTTLLSSQPVVNKSELYEGCRPQRSARSDSYATQTTPKKTESDETNAYIYKVQTKHAAMFHSLLVGDHSSIMVGDFVVVEADRGEALGVVTQKTLKKDFKEVKATAGYRGKGSSAVYDEDKRLLRLATKDERIQLPGKLLKEEEATRLCRDMIKKRGLNLAIVNSEYQFDGGKLTFFYQADLRIDFRELVCELFNTFKTRIWMQQGNTLRLLLTKAFTHTFWIVLTTRVKILIMSIFIVDSSFQPDIQASHRLSTGEFVNVNLNKLMKGDLG